MSRNMHDEESFYSRGQKLQPQPPKRSQLLIIGLVFAIGILIGAVGSQLLHSSQQLTTTLGITPTTTLGITPTPSPIPSPTPTQITITKNLVIPCMSTCAIALKLTTIVIDTTTQTSTWNFTLTNTTDSVQAKFSTLELEDSTGQKHQGAGLAKTDTWVMSSGQTILTNATFDVVHGAHYWILRNSADVGYGMLRVCTVFQKTIRLLPLMVLVLVFSLLISLAPMEHSTFQQIEFGATIHTPFNQLEPIHMALQRPITPRQS